MNYTNLKSHFISILSLSRQITKKKYLYVIILIFLASQNVLMVFLYNHNLPKPDDYDGFKVAYLIKNDVATLDDFF